MKSFAIIVGVIVALIVLVGFFLPARFTLERRQVIQAPKKFIFAQINDLKKHEAWSPWKLSDMDMQIKYGEKTVGEGASYSWNSRQSGEGMMTILESKPDVLIRASLQFKGKQRGISYWKFNQKTESQVEVIQGFEGDVGHNIIARYLVFILGDQFAETQEIGLIRLKKICESR